MKREILVQAVKTYPEKDRAFCFQLSEDLKSKQIANAIKGYAGGVRPEEVVALLDTTVLGSGKAGFLLTENKIYGSYGKDSCDIDRIFLYREKETDTDVLVLLYEDGSEQELCIGVYPEIVSFIGTLIALQKESAKKKNETDFIGAVKKRSQEKTKQEKTTSPVSEGGRVSECGRVSEEKKAAEAPRKAAERHRTERTPHTTADVCRTEVLRARKKEEVAEVLWEREELREAEEAVRIAEEKQSAAEARLLRAKQRVENARRKAETARRHAEEAARAAEEKRHAEEAARIAEEKRRAEEAARAAEEKRRAEEAARAAEEKRRAEEAARAAEEERRLEEWMRAEEEKHRAEEAARAAEESARAEKNARARAEIEHEEEPWRSIKTGMMRQGRLGYVEVQNIVPGMVIRNEGKKYLVIAVERNEGEKDYRYDTLYLLDIAYKGTLMSAGKHDPVASKGCQALPLDHGESAEVLNYTECKLFDFGIHGRQIAEFPERIERYTMQYTSYEKENGTFYFEEWEKMFNMIFVPEQTVVDSVKGVKEGADVNVWFYGSMPFWVEKR